MTQTTTPQQAAQWLASGDAILIDVREPDEFHAGHIAYAHSFPLSRFEEALAQMQCPPDKKIIMQCLRGKRGEQACIRVQKNSGRPNPLYNLEGGINAWKEAGLPIISMDSGEPKISIFRQVQIIIGFLIALFVTLGFFNIMAGFFIAGLLGAALFIAGLTGWCGLALLLGKMPWNRH